MREIKFRAWGKESNRWFYYDELDGRTHIIPDQEMSESFQFTGLKDKNGVEIYEGDIVSIKNGTSGEHLMNGVVKWYPAFFDIEMNGKMHCVDAGVFERSEVIGNAHENPELLA